MGYIQRIDETPPMYPFQCASCLLTHNEEITYFIDTGISHDPPTGVVYICNRCLAEMNRVSGKYLPTDELDARIQGMQEFYADESRELEKLRSAVGILASAFSITPDQLISLGSIQSTIDESTREGIRIKSEINASNEQYELLNKMIKEKQDTVTYVDSLLEQRNKELEQLLRPVEEVLQSGILGTSYSSPSGVEPFNVTGTLPESSTSREDSGDFGESSSESESLQTPSFGS